MDNMLDFSGKVIIVTGGGKGVGCPAAIVAEAGLFDFAPALHVGVFEWALVLGKKQGGAEEQGSEAEPRASREKLSHVRGRCFCKKQK